MLPQNTTGNCTSPCEKRPDKCTSQNKRRAFKSPLLQKNSQTSKITGTSPNRILVAEENIRILKQVQRLQEKDEIGRLENLVSKWKLVAQHAAMDVLGALNSMSWDCYDGHPETITLPYLLNRFHISFETVGYNEVTEQFE